MQDKKRGDRPLRDLKIINPIVRDHGIIASLLEGISKDLTLKTLTTSGLHLDYKSLLYLNHILQVSKPCLIEIDISWCKIAARQMQTLFESLTQNNVIRSLNVSYNSIAFKDKLIQLCSFIKKCNTLQHLDLSGMLQTSS